MVDKVGSSSVAEMLFRGAVSRSLRSRSMPRVESGKPVYGCQKDSGRLRAETPAEGESVFRFRTTPPPRGGLGGEGSRRVFPSAAAAAMGLTATTPTRPAAANTGTALTCRDRADAHRVS